MLERVVEDPEAADGCLSYQRVEWDYRSNQEALGSVQLPLSNRRHLQAASTVYCSRLWRTCKANRNTGGKKGGLTSDNERQSTLRFIGCKESLVN